MKIKKILSLTLGACVFLGTSFTTFAAPKQMPDGTMFDAQFYAQTYPDVANALGTDEAVLYNHYVQSGKAEGRKATADSAAQSTPAQVTAQSGRSAIYRLSDKQMKDVLYHVFDTGEGEGVYFDEIQYAAVYPDVAASVGTSHNALWKHYKTKGIYEGRQAYVKDIYPNPSWNDINKNNVLILNAVVTLTDEKMSDREICKIAHDWVCSHLIYDRINVGNHSYRAGVHLGVGKCAEYADIFGKFVTFSGLKNHIISGTINGEGHAWNAVWVDGHRYEVDCTWDDNDNIKYDYFLVEKAH